jgi:anti-sigma regulatory factor (Ser/Thr protein kinase)
MTATGGSRLSGAGEFEFTVSADVGALGSMRRKVAGVLGKHEVGVAAVDDCLLILSELCTNAIQAMEPGTGAVLVRVRVGATDVTLEVENAGRPFDVEAAAAQLRAGSDIERGRGLVIVRALADEVTLRHHEGHSIVRVVLRLS